MDGAAHKEADVLIVGAGLCGLMLAVQLLRYGIRPYIIEEMRDTEVPVNPLILQTRTLEYFRQLGLDDELRAKAVAIDDPNNLLPFGSKSPVMVPLNNFFVVSPTHIERPLLQWLGDQACPIYWHSTLTNVFQQENMVMAQILQAAEERELHIPWVVYTRPADTLHGIDHTIQFAEHRLLYVGSATGRLLKSGGQSINTDLQDAVNLGWKLALVAGGKAAPALLDSYTKERKDIPNDALALQGKAVFISQKPPLGNHWLLAIQEAFLKWQLRNPERLRSFADMLSQLGISYRHSPLSHHHAHGTRIRAGDRLPDLPVFDEKTKSTTSLQQWCRKPGFVLLLLGTLNKNSLFVLSQWVLNKFPDVLQLFYLPYSTANDPVFEAFEIPSEAVKMVIIRPDMHIGYINDTISAALVETYLNGVVGMV